MYSIAAIPKPISTAAESSGFESRGGQVIRWSEPAAAPPATIRATSCSQGS